MTLVFGAGINAAFYFVAPFTRAVGGARTPPRLHGTVMSLVTGVMDLGAVLGTPLCGAVALMARDPHREDRVARV